MWAHTHIYKFISTAESLQGEDQADHLTEGDRCREALPMIQASQDAQVPVAAHHKTTTRDDPHIEEDAVLLHTDIRSATLCLSVLVLMKTSYTQIGHLMAKHHSTLHFNLWPKRAVNLSQ